MKILKQEFWLRYFIQILFIIWSLLAGIELYLFMQSLGGSPDLQTVKPTGTEAFLPISSLAESIFFLKTGSSSGVHPAGFIIFVTVLLITLLLGRGFCSYVCPFGTFSEYLISLRNRFFKRELKLPKFLDYPLRSLKYLLLAFFLVSIGLMSTMSLGEFLGSSYNRVADIKMFLFFQNAGSTTLLIISALIVLSFFISNFWCRYLCPYGALLTLAALARLVKIERDRDTCVSCGICTDHCPNRIEVHTKGRVSSLECTNCSTCIKACPHAALDLSFKWSRHKKNVSQLVYAALLVTLLYFIPEAAKAFGTWHSNTSQESYREIYRNINNLEHPR